MVIIFYKMKREEGNIIHNSKFIIQNYSQAHQLVTIWLRVEQVDATETVKSEEGRVMN